MYTLLHNYGSLSYFIFNISFYLVFLHLTENWRVTAFVLIAGFFTQRHLLLLQNQVPIQS